MLAFRVFLGVLGAALAGGCTDLKPGTDRGDAGQPAVDTGPADAGIQDAGPGDAGEPPCPAVDERPLRQLPLDAEGEHVIDEDTLWTCDEIVVLAGPTLVDGATLTIDPGTVVRGSEGSLLMVTRDSRIEAIGTATEPIVFTSAVQGGRRAAGDWRGLFLLGSAPAQGVNSRPADARIDDPRSFYGGSVNDWSCGSLAYVRVEFAGGEVNDNALPGSALTLAGCGTGTRIDYVQVHQATDGLGIYGGTVRPRHVVVSAARNDAVEWATGYRGDIQFLIAHAGPVGTGIRGNNLEGMPTQEPVSHPTIANATIVGVQNSLSPDSHVGVQFQFGTEGRIMDSIVTGFASFGVNVGDEPTADRAGAGEISVDHTFFFGNGDAVFPGAGPEGAEGNNDDGGFDEGGFFRALAGNELTVDPGIAASRQAFDDPETASVEPDFRPMSSGVLREPSTPPEGVELELVGHRGALPPGDGSAWTDDWTSYPES